MQFVYFPLPAFMLYRHITLFADDITLIPSSGSRYWL